MKKYFENGEQVKLVNNHGEDFDVKILNRVCDLWDCRYKSVGNYYVKVGGDK